MANNSIPDWKKAAILALHSKYGYRAIGKRLDIHRNTVKDYIKEADETGELEASGINMEVAQ